MYTSIELLKSVSRVSLLGENYLHISFRQGTPSEKIEFFLRNLYLSVPGISLEYPMILLESQIFSEHISIKLSKLPKRRFGEVFIFEKNEKEKTGAIFKLSEVTH